MKSNRSRHTAAFLAAFLSTVAWGGAAAAPSPQAGGRYLGALGLRFEPRQGPEGARFTARGPGYRLELADRAHVLELRNGAKAATITTKILGARPVAARGENRLPGVANYLTGDDAARWRTSVPGFERVRYTALYPGVDLYFYGKDGKLEYDFVVAPGADPSVVRLGVSGGRGMRVDANGDLAIATNAGEVRWNRPVVYQQDGASRREIRGRFVVRGAEVGFDIAEYDPSRPLVIDPTLSYLSYLGGSGNESARSIAVDASGNVFIAGNTSSPDLPKTGGTLQPNYGGNSLDAQNEKGDAFVAKFAADGTLAWVTYIGGKGNEAAMGLALDAAGNPYITGYTNSADFKTTTGRPYQGPAAPLTGYHRGGDAFVVKLSADGKSMLMSTLIGGSSDDWGLGIALDGTGNIYIAGATLSSNFPATAGAIRSTYGGGVCVQDIYCGGDGFVAKLSSTGAVVYATYLGGAGNDSANAIAVDSAGNAYVAGGTTSNNFPIAGNAFQKTYGGALSSGAQPYFSLGDAFVAKVNPTGTGLAYSTYLGGSGDDLAGAIAVDSTGAAYVTGATSSPNFPVSASAPQKKFGGPSATSYYDVVFGDGFATKVSPDGSSLAYSTYFGGEGDDVGFAIAIDAAGNAYIGGSSNSSSFPATDDALQKTMAGTGWQRGWDPGDAVLVKIKADGTAFAYASYFGGGRDDAIGGLALDKDGNVYVTGSTVSTDLKTTSNAAQKAYIETKPDYDFSLAIGDTFFAKFTGLSAPPPPATTVAGISNAASYDATGVAPGEMVAIFGTKIGPTTLAGAALDANGRLSTNVANTQVFFDDVAAPIVYVYDTQTAVVVPYEVQGKQTTKVTVAYNGTTSAPFTVSVKAAIPGLFSNDQTGKGQGAIYQYDPVTGAASRNSPSNPVAMGSLIALYGSGEGQTVPAGVDGKVAADPYPKPVLGVPTVTIGGVPATDIPYYGAVPTVSAGIFQINVRVPQGLDTTKPQEVVVQWGSFKSQTGLTLSVK